MYASAGTYVAIRATQGDWYGVMMADGSLGWLPAERVRLLDFEVVSDGSVGLPSMGGGLPGASPQDDVSPQIASRPQATLNPLRNNTANRDAKTVLVDFEAAA